MSITGGVTRGVVVLLALVFFALSGVSATPAQDLAVCNAGTNTLVRVGTKGNSDPVTLATFTAPCLDVKVLDATTTYVSVPGNNSVEAVNVVTKTATSIPTALGPQKMALNAAGTRLYIATSTNVTVIDTATNTIVPAENIELSAYGGNAFAIAIRGNLLAIGTTFDIHLFDVTDIPVHIAQLYAATRPLEILFNDNITEMYVACEGLTGVMDENGNFSVGNLLVLRISPFAFKTALSFGVADIQNLALRSPYLYGTSSNGILYWFDTSTNTIPDTPFLTIDGNIMDIVIDGNAYVGNQSFGSIQTIRLGRKSPAGDVLDGVISLPPGSVPLGIAAIPSPTKGKKP